MNTRECIVTCVGIIAGLALIAAVILTLTVGARVRELTEAISQPGLTSTVSVERFSVTTPEPDAVTFELIGLEAEMNSRVLDLFMNAIIEAEMR